jgi:6-phosphogluconolactonase
LAIFDCSFAWTGYARRGAVLPGVGNPKPVDRSLTIDNRQSAIVNPEIRIFDDLEHLSWAAATQLEQVARVKAVEKKPLSVAFSGGSTPKLLFELLSNPGFQGRVRWANLQVFQVDERCVPPDDPQSNYRMMRRSLLESVPLPEQNFHRMAAERSDRDEAARDYADELARALHPAPGEWPRLDLVFLGMGPDGHTASLFPGSAALDERTAWVAPNFAPKLNSFRLTLTFPVLNAAAHVIFLVAGADKAETLRQVLEGPAGQFPAQRIQPTSGRLSWFLDQSAAKLLGNQ